MPTLSNYPMVIIMPRELCRQIYVKQGEVLHSVYLFNLGFVIASGNSSVFHVREPRNEGGTRQLIAGGNIGSFAEELGPYFLPPNQSTFVNRIYIDRIVKDCVKLFYPGKYPDIIISRRMRKEFIEAMRSLEPLAESSPSGNPQKDPSILQLPFPHF